MTLHAIVDALGGDLYDRGRRANVPAPGHSRADRSVSLLLSDGRVVAHGFGGSDWREALDDLRARGLIDAAGVPSSGLPARSARASPSPGRAERLAVARRLWADGRAIAADTLSARHLRLRGVLRQAGDCAALRHHPSAPLSVYRFGRFAAPAFMAAIRDADGALTAVELTYLAPNGRRAVGLHLPRKTVGLLPSGSAVRLDPAASELLVGEGVFTALSAAERFSLPGWALLSTSNLRTWRPPPGVGRVLIAADRGRDGEASAALLARRLRAAGLRVRVRLPPPVFGDWNEAALGAGGVREPRRPWEGEEGRGSVRRTGRTGLSGRRGRPTVTDTNTQTPSPEPRLRRLVPLRDLGVAPENMRYREPPDEEIPQLADTILAAGLLQPLTVRPGKRKEKPSMALDGRRRLLALERLRDAGHIDDGHLVEVVEETDPGRQAAAVLLTNTALPVHVADVIASIGKMLKAKLTVPAISHALGYAEVQIKRLAALSGLHPKALAALKAGKLTQSQARLLARLPDPALQAELAEQALAGLGFQGWRVNERLERGRVTALDRRFALVGAERYAAAGGRTEADLFGGLPDQLLDGGVLQDLWTERAQVAAAPLEAEGLTVHLSDDGRVELEGGLEFLGYVRDGTLTEPEQAAYDAALQAYRAAAGDVRDRDLSTEEGPARLADLLRARLAAEQAAEPRRVIRAAVLWPAGRLGIDSRFYGERLQATEADDDGAGVGSEMPDAAALRRERGEVDVPSPEVALEGVGHALHETRTDLATRGLIRALADDPGAALVALVARLFTVLALESARPVEASALAIAAQAYRRPKHEPVDALDGEVRRRLAGRRSAWKASGLRPIPWVSELPHGERMSLLAELVALSLDLREAKTTALRPCARADAAEIATLACGEVAAYWTPDEAFLRAHGKKQLLAMLDAMGATDDRARTLKKDELVQFVVERAAERGWAPSEVGWAVESPSIAAAAAADETLSPVEPTDAAPLVPQASFTPSDVDDFAVAA